MSVLEKLIAYVYNQQPNVGLLVIAASRMEGLPFVDFSVVRSTSANMRFGRKYLTTIAQVLL